VLLIDEIDRADDEFEAFLLEMLAENAVTIPELGTIRAQTPPLVVLTSNRTREVHDALKRRCLYHWVEHPELEREVEIILQRVPGAAALIAREVALVVRRLREMGLVKPPGVAESIDWVQALLMVGARRLDGEAAAATLGAAVKYREDQLRVRREVWPALEELLSQ
jgi:MoxR-like ATPase